MRLPFFSTSSLRSTEPGPLNYRESKPDPFARVTPLTQSNDSFPVAHFGSEFTRNPPKLNQSRLVFFKAPASHPILSIYFDDIVLIHSENVISRSKRNELPSKLRVNGRRIACRLGGGLRQEIVLL